MYCRNCGNELKESEKFCPKCRTERLNEGEIAVEKEMPKKTKETVKKSFGKRYLKLIGFLILIYFVVLIIELILRMSGIIINNGLKTVLRIFQFAVPIYGMAFGWLLILIYDAIKGK